MDYKKLGLSLGLFSIGLGLLEVTAPGRLARWLGVDGKNARRTIGLFGARELLAGALLLRGPAVSTNVWNRVLGDGMDITALGLALSRGSRRGFAAGAFSLVAGVTLVDILTARGLSKQTGRTFPPPQLAASKA